MLGGGVSGVSPIGFGLLFSLKNRFSGEAKRIEADMERLGLSSNTLAGKISSARKRMTTGFKMMALGGAIAFSFVPAIKAASNFNAAMRQTYTLAQFTAEEQKVLRSNVLALAKVYGEDPLVQARTSYQVVSAGYRDAAEAVQMMTVAGKAAIAGAGNTQEAFEALVASMKPFGYEALQAEMVADKLFKTIERGITTLPELSSVLNQAAPMAAAIGTSLDEMLGSIATLTATTKATTAIATTQMSSMYSGIMRYAERAQKLNKKYGLSLEFGVAALEKKGWVKFLEDIEAQIGQLDRDTKFIVLNKLFGRKEAVRGYLSLIPAMKTLKENINQVENSAGASQRAFEIMAASLSFTLKRLKISIKTMLISIGTAVGPMVAMLSRGFTIVVNAITKAIDSFPGLSKFVLQTTFLFGVLTFAAGAFLTVVGLIQLGIYTGLLPALIPLIAIVGSIAAGIVLLRMVWESNFMGIRDAIKRTFGPYVTILKEAFKAWKTFNNGIVTMSEDTARKLEEEGLLGPTIKVLKMIYRLHEMYKGFRATIRESLDEIESDYRPIFEGLAEIFSPLKALFRKLADLSTETRASWYSLFGGALAGKARRCAFYLHIVSIPLKFLVSLLGKVSRGMSWLYGWLDRASYIIGRKVSGVFDGINAALTRIINRVRPWAERIKAIIDPIIQRLNKVIQLANRIPGIRNVAESIRKAVAGPLGVVAPSIAMSPVPAGWPSPFTPQGRKPYFWEKETREPPRTPVDYLRSTTPIYLNGGGPEYYKEIRETTKEREVQTPQGQPQVINLNIDGKQIARVVNDVNRKEMTKRL